MPNLFLKPSVNVHLCSALLLLFFVAPLLAQSYPYAESPEEIYKTFDLPEAPAGDTQFFESFKEGADASSATLRSSDGRQKIYSGQWGKIWVSVESGNASDVYGMKQAVGIRTWDFFPKRGANVIAQDTDIVHNNRVLIYMMNIYKHDNGALLGFLHIEDLRPGGCDSANWTAAQCNRLAPSHVPSGLRYGSKYRIGLAYCDPASPSYPCEGGGWQFLGMILAPKNNFYDTASKVSSNIAGVPYMIKDGYFYVYFLEHGLEGANKIRKSAVARASIDSVMDQASHFTAGHNVVGTKSPWHKFNGGGSCYNNPSQNSCWTVDPMTGEGAAIRTDLGPMVSDDSDPLEEYRDLHTDMVYSTVTRKYYMPIKFDVLRLHSSSDGITWTRRDSSLQLAVAPQDPTYATIIPDSSDRISEDGRMVGSRFYVMYHQTIPNDTDNVCWGAPQDTNRRCRNNYRIYRVRVRVAPPSPLDSVITITGKINVIRMQTNGNCFFKLQTGPNKWYGFAAGTTEGQRIHSVILSAKASNTKITFETFNRPYNGDATITQVADVVFVPE